MTPAQMAAKVVFPAFRFGTPAPHVEELVRCGVSGFCLYEGSASDWPALTSRLQGLASTPLLFAADFEDGAGQVAAGGLRMPSNMAVAATGQPDMAALKAAVTAAEARALGVGMILAPCVDLNTNPKNPIIDIRAFTDHPDAAIRFGGAMLDAYRTVGVLSCLKHFPGHGDVETDSHIATPVVRHGLERLRRVELAPFFALLPRADAVMTAHLLIPELDPHWPASVSTRITDGLLRREMGFEGLVITDALCMGGIAHLKEEEAAVLALQAGADIVLYPKDPRRCVARIERAIRSGELPAARLDASVDRICRATAKLACNSPIPVDREAARRIAEGSITLVRHADHCLPLQGPVDYVGVIDTTATEGDAPFRRALGEIRSGSDTVVIAMYIRPRAWAGRNRLSAEQIARIREACRPNRRAIGVSFGSPYLMEDVPELKTFVCAYSDCEASQTAAAKAIRGQIPFLGSLPVAIQGVHAAR